MNKNLRWINYFNGKHLFCICFYLLLITQIPNLRYFVGNDSHYSIESLANILVAYVAGLFIIFLVNTVSGFDYKMNGK